MGLPWVQGLIRGEMKGGRITARVIERHTMTSDRPANLQASGADLAIYEKLRARQEDFTFKTYGFLGGAVAWILQTSRLTLLQKNLMPRLEAFNRAPLSDVMYVALVRNAGAPTIQFCAEPAGGMPEAAEVDWLFDLLDEGTELGIYDDDVAGSYGWLGFQLPRKFERYQEGLNEKQKGWWRVVRPGFPQIGSADVEFLPIGQDELDGEPGIICPCLAAGEFSFLKVATLDLPSINWKLCDLECRRKGEAWAPLNRAVVGIVPRHDERGRQISPMLYRFSPNGGLDHCGPHFPLSGEVVEYALSHLSIPLLGPRGLNWLR